MNKGIETEDLITSLRAISGLLSILWEATDGNEAVCDSVYGIREYLDGVIERVEKTQRPNYEEG